VTEAIEKAGGASAGLFLYGPSTMFGQHARMPDDDTARFAFRTADQRAASRAEARLLAEAAVAAYFADRGELSGGRSGDA
jgi:hypothetical protein